MIKSKEQEKMQKSKNFELFNRPRRAYSRMIEDIKNAKKSIYLETYIYDDDRVGRLFRKVLERKAKEGLEIKILVDAFGSTAKKKFFKKLKEFGGEVRFFRDLYYTVRFFTMSQEIDHRKLLIIDNKISYLGSINITETCLNWRELVLRLTNGIAEEFTVSFMKIWDTKGNFNFKRMNKLIHQGYEIIQDTPAKLSNSAERNFVRLVNQAKKEVMVETPYFVPSWEVRRALAKAARRGVKVRVVVPYISGLKTVDLIRESYMGEMWKNGVYVYYYQKSLHSKLLIIDDEFFMLGSSNIDYRSFIYDYNINVIGRNKEIIKALKEHYNGSLAKSIPLDYGQWKSRPVLQRIGELIMLTVRKYF